MIVLAKLEQAFALLQWVRMMFWRSLGQVPVMGPALTLVLQTVVKSIAVHLTQTVVASTVVAAILEKVQVDTTRRAEIKKLANARADEILKKMANSPGDFTVSTEEQQEFIARLATQMKVSLEDDIAAKLVVSIEAQKKLTESLTKTLNASLWNQMQQINRAKDECEFEKNTSFLGKGFSMIGTGMGETVSFVLQPLVDMIVEDALQHLDVDDVIKKITIPTGTKSEFEKVIGVMVNSFKIFDPTYNHENRMRLMRREKPLVTDCETMTMGVSADTDTKDIPLGFVVPEQ